MTTKNIKTASEVITEFLVSRAKDETLDADTVAAVSKLRKDDDLSKVKAAAEAGRYAQGRTQG